MLPSTSWIVGAAAVLVVGAAVTGERVVKREPVKGKTTVIYWEKWTGEEGAAMRKIVDDFNASQDRIYVEMLSISGVNDKTLLATSGGNPPDVAGLWGEQVVQFAEVGAAMDLTDFAKEFGITKEQYIPVYWDFMTVHDRIYAFPSTPASTALHVRRDKTPPELRDPAKFPQTIEEFDALVDKASVKHGDKIDLAYFLPAEPGWWNFAWGYFFGGNLFDGEKLTINSPENVKGFEWMQSYAKRFGAQQVQTFKSGFGNFSSPQNAFIEGKVGSVLQGVWMANYIGMYDKKLDWFAVPFPHPKDRPDLAEVSFANFDTLQIPKGAKHPREAFEFIAFVQTQKEMEKLCASHGKNSPLTKVSEEFFRTHKNPYIRLFDHLARGKNAIHPPKTGAWPEINAEINTAVEAMNLNQVTAKESLDQVQERCAAALKRYDRFVRGTK